MEGKISGFDFLNAKAQKYWSFPASYDKNKRQETLNLMLYSDDYVASEKRDGYFQFIIKDDDGNVFMRAREQGVHGWICKQDWVPHLHSFFNALPKGTCLVSEIYLEGKTSRNVTTILGCGTEKAIARQEQGEKLLLSVFDVLAWDGSLLFQLPIVDRINYLDDVRAAIRSSNNQFVKVVDYWCTPDDIHENWLRILSEGGEGVVLTLKSNPYEFGKRTARHTLKLKKELQDTIDVFITGNWKEPKKNYSGTQLETWPYWYDEVEEKKIEGCFAAENDRTLSEKLNTNALVPVNRLWFYNWAAAIEVATYINGKVVPIGWISGISDNVREGIVSHPEDWIGRVVELQAMEMDTTGLTPTLRHAKIVNWRTDKKKEDCIWNG